MNRGWDLVRQTTTTAGTGTITLGPAVTGFQTFAAAGSVDGTLVTYGIEDANGNHGVEDGILGATGTTLTRGRFYGSNTGARLSLSGSAQVFATLSAAELRGNMAFRLDPPVQLGTIALPSSPRDIVVIDNYAYVTCATDGLRIYDVADPANIVLVGAIALSATPITGCLAVADGIAYCLLVTTGVALDIIDVSNPAVPVRLSNSNSGGGNGQAMAVAGKYLYCNMGAASGTFRVTDISNPVNPGLMGSVVIAGSGSSSSMTVRGHFAYLAYTQAVVGTGGFCVINIADPNNPVVVSTVNLAVDGRGVAVRGRYAYVTAGSNTDVIYVIDVSNPAAAVSVGSFDTGNFGTISARPVIAGDYLAYAVASSPSVTFVDISTPNAPVAWLSLNTVSSFGLALEGDRLYNLASTPALVIYSMTGIRAPAAAIGALRVDRLHALGDADFARDVRISGKVLGGGVPLYQPPSNNYVRNPSFDIWQAGTAFTTQGRIADLWSTNTIAGRTYSRQAGFAGARYCVRVQRDSGNAVASQLWLHHVLTPEDAAALAGKTCMISAAVRGGANFSQSTGLLTLVFLTGTGIDEPLTGTTPVFATGSVTSANLNLALTTAVASLAGSYVIPANATEVGFRIGYTPVGTAGAADYFDVTNVKMEVGSAPTPFEPERFDRTLLECKRSYEVFCGNTANEHVSRGYADSTTHGFFDLLYQEKRTTPAITISGAATDFELQRQGSAVVATTALAATAAHISKNSCQLDATVAAGLTAGEGLGLKGKTTNARIIVDARL